MHLLAAGVINPGAGSPPPGVVGPLTTVLEWAAWTGLAVCVLAVIVVGATMALNHRRGGGGEHGSSLGYVLAGAVLIGTASGIIGAITP